VPARSWICRNMFWIAAHRLSRYTICNGHGVKSFDISISYYRLINKKIDVPFFENIGSLDPSSSSMALCHKASSSTVHPDVLMSFDNSSTARFHIDKKFLPTFGNSFKVSELDQVHGKSQTVVTKGCIENNEEDENAFSYHHHDDMTSSWSPGTHQAVETMFLTVSETEEAGMFDVHFANVNLGSPRARWCKVKAAFKVRAAFKEVRRHTTARNPREGL